MSLRGSPAIVGIRELPTLRNGDTVGQAKLITFSSALETAENGGAIWRSRVWYPMS